MQTQLGTDPEFFIQDQNGNLVSSVGLIEGTKHDPVHLDNGVYVMKDNVAIEFGMLPASSEEEWLDRLADAYQQIEQYLPKEYQLCVRPSAYFTADQLNTKEACEFGCDPDYNAWYKCRNAAPNGVDTDLRSCGGHVHIDLTKLTNKKIMTDMGRYNTVRVMDAFLGVPSVILDRGKGAEERRNLYGKAGCHRFTDYGVEYRVLSNFWMKKRAFQRFVWNATLCGLENLENDYDETARWVGKHGRGIIEAIDYSSNRLAKDFVELNAVHWWNKKTREAWNEAVSLVA